MITEELKTIECREAVFFHHVENQDVDLYRFGCGFVFPNLETLEGYKVESARQVHLNHHQRGHKDKESWRMMLDAATNKFSCDCINQVRGREV